MFMKGINKHRMDKVVLGFMKKMLVDVPTPVNMSYWWGFGSLLGLFLVSQIMSGLLLAMHFMPQSDLAFSSVDFLMRDITEGWLMRSLHAKGASFFFFFLYLHLGRNLYYNSFFFKLTWYSGLKMLIVSMAVAFFGYVLPWGKMSYWGAAVITNLFSVIPYFGDNFVSWVWGGFSVVSATLTRFFVLHFLLPFIMIFLVLLHLMFLHEKGSKKPLGMKGKKDKMMFYPYFGVSDFYGFGLMFMIFFFICLFLPYIFLCCENFTEANMLSTPEHMEPDWFLLLPYAMLRSIPNKLGGVLGLMSTILIFYMVPFIFMGSKRGKGYNIQLQCIFWWWVLTVLFLSFLGASPVESPFMELGQIFGVFYFSFFFFVSVYVSKL